MASDPAQWTVSVDASAQPTLQGLRNTYGEDWYTEQKKAFKQAICDYVDRCPNGLLNVRESDSICPIKGGHKMRWAIAGGGKRGGLRLAVKIDVATKTIEIRFAEIRKNEPDIDELVEALLG